MEDIRRTIRSVGNPALGDVYNVDIVEISERFKRPKLECESVLRKYEADWGFGMSLGRAHQSVAPPCVNRIGEVTREWADHFQGTTVPPPVSKDELAEALQYDHISNLQKTRELLSGKLPTTAPVELSYTASPVVKRSYETPRPAVAPLAKAPEPSPSPGLRSPTVGGGAGRRVTISENPAAPTPRGAASSAAAVNEALVAAGRTPAARARTPAAAVGGGAEPAEPAPRSVRRTPAAVGGGAAAAAAQGTPARTLLVGGGGTEPAAQPASEGGGARTAEPEPAAPSTPAPTESEVRSTIKQAKQELSREFPEALAKVRALPKSKAAKLRTRVFSYVLSNWVIRAPAALVTGVKNMLLQPTALEAEDVRRLDASRRQEEAGTLLKEAVVEAKRREAQRKRDAALSKLQAVVRGKLARKAAAATIVQAAVRGRQARTQAKELRTERKQAAAATVLQAAVRGRQARKEVSEKRAKETAAATVLQAAVRGRKARVATAKIKAEASARLAPPQPPPSEAAVEGLEDLSWTVVHQRWKEATGNKAKNKTKAEMIADIRARVPRATASQAPRRSLGIGPNRGSGRARASVGGGSGSQ